MQKNVLKILRIIKMFVDLCIKLFNVLKTINL